MIREPKGVACANVEGSLPILDATRIPVSRSKGQRSGSPGPLMLTHIVRHICEWQRLRTSNSVYGWSTMNRISHRRDDFQGERSRSQGHVISQCCTYVITGRRGHTVSVEPGGHTFCLLQLTTLTSLTRCLKASL